MTTDELVPVRRDHRGKTQAFIEDELRANPGVWMLYPHPVGKPQALAYSYTQRHAGTDWACDQHGRLIGRWVGE
jgi:hypothetical protein